MADKKISELTEVSTTTNSDYIVLDDGTDTKKIKSVTLIPSKTSDLTNDSGFITSHQSLAAYRTSAAQDVIDNGKQDELTAGSNITINNNVISATDTVYSAGNGISINDNTIASKVTFSLSGTTLTITVNN